MMEYLKERFFEVYKPNREVAVDEAMIKFHGRSSLKQYLPKKPIKRGIKVWVLGDSHFVDFQVYTGKVGGRTETGLGARVVKDLTSKLKGRNHHVFFDNYFCSPQLLDDLLSSGFYACGTVNSSRKGFPSDLKAVTRLEER